MRTVLSEYVDYPTWCAPPRHPKGAPPGVVPEFTATNPVKDRGVWAARSRPRGPSPGAVPIQNASADTGGRKRRRGRAELADFVPLAELVARQARAHERERARRPGTGLVHGEVTNGDLISDRGPLGTRFLTLSAIQMYGETSKRTVRNEVTF